MIESIININNNLSNTQTADTIESSNGYIFIESSNNNLSSQGTSPEPEVIYDNYIYQDNLQIVRSESDTIIYDNIYNARHYLDIYIRDRFKTTATIPDINGIDYVINIKNIIAYNIDGDTIYIEFLNTDILTITCVNSIHARKHYEYLDKLYTGYKIFDTFNGTRYEVNEGESITQAVQGSSAGDLVIVNSGLYNESILLKNGVDIFFMPECTVTFNSGYGIFNDRISFRSAVVCNIYGFPNITATDCLAVGLWNDNSDVYLEANEIVQSGALGCFYQSSADVNTTNTLRIKGYSVLKTLGGTLGVSDFDSVGDVNIDYDFIKIVSYTSNILYGFTSATGSVQILRNMYGSANTPVSIESSNFYEGSLMTHIFVNCKFKNTANGAGTIFLSYDPTTDGWTGQHEAYFHNTYTTQTGYCIYSTYAITSYMYGRNISKTGNNIFVILAGTGTLTIDSTLTLTEV